MLRIFKLCWVVKILQVQCFWSSITRYEKIRLLALPVDRWWAPCGRGTTHLPPSNRQTVKTPTNTNSNSNSNGNTNKPSQSHLPLGHYNYNYNNKLNPRVCLVLRPSAEQVAGPDHINVTIDSSLQSATSVEMKPSNVTTTTLICQCH